MYLVGDAVEMVLKDRVSRVHLPHAAFVEVGDNAMQGQVLRELDLGARAVREPDDRTFPVG